MQIELSEIVALINQQTTKPVPFVVGESYFIRTVTYYAVGRVARIVGNFVVLEQAAWVADSGRWHDALKTGKLNEVEPFVDECIVNVEAIVDATKWRHELPTKQC